MPQLFHAIASNSIALKRRRSCADVSRVTVGAGVYEQRAGRADHDNPGALQCYGCDPCITRHTSHLTPHTSHVTRHTSHVKQTRQIPFALRRRSLVLPPPRLRSAAIAPSPHNHRKSPPIPSRPNRVAVCVCHTVTLPSCACSGAGCGRRFSAAAAAAAAERG